MAKSSLLKGFVVIGAWATAVVFAYVVVIAYILGSEKSLGG
jgi:hypothetical protein